MLLKIDYQRSKYLAEQGEGVWVYEAYLLLEFWFLRPVVLPGPITAASASAASGNLSKFKLSESNSGGRVHSLGQ